MYAYIDESGNTGFHLFDPEQPYFLNVAMSSKIDFDTVYQQHVARIAQAAGAPRLHASEMRFEGVESVAEDVIDLVKSSQVKFHFAFVNKSDAAIIKFFDSIFDPGENQAAPPHIYSMRDLRNAMLCKFAALLTLNDVELFWSALAKGWTPETEKEAACAIENILRRIETLPDRRSKELIGDTLHWAIENISKFSFWAPTKQLHYSHLPNLFTIPALFSHISRTATEWKCGIDKIIHDQQSQFQGALEELHAFLVNSGSGRSFEFGDTLIQYPDVHNSQFNMVDSRTSAGLQVVDIVLWTFARSVSNKPLGEKSTALFNYCFSLDNLYFLSLDWICTELSARLSEIMNHPVNDSKHSETIQLMERVERIRQDRMRASQ